MNFLNWYFSKRLKWKKMRLLHEVVSDIKYLEECRNVLDSVKSERALREKLSLEQSKEKPDQTVIDGIAEEIAYVVARRGEYNKLKRIEQELPGFIEML